MSRDLATIDGGMEQLPRQDQSVQRWAGAAGRAETARDERQKIIKSVLVEGVDFGTIPGCGTKPALFKSGAEKVADALDLCPHFIPIREVEDVQLGYFFYRYRCELRQRGSNMVVSTGIGSCSTYEAKYRYRQGQRVCPDCGEPRIIKGKEEYGGGWLCWAAKGGCGSKWPDGAAEIEDQEVGQIDNPNIHDCVNTVDKIAQKRALVQSALVLGFSQDFTQDVEDNPSAFTNGGGSTTSATEEQPAAATQQAEPAAKRPHKNTPGSHRCPNCNSDEFVIKSKAEYGGGWVCWKSKGGCGCKFQDDGSALPPPQSSRQPSIGDNLIPLTPKGVEVTALDEKDMLGYLAWLNEKHYQGTINEIAEFCHNYDAAGWPSKAVAARVVELAE